ncbi:MAG: LVIVD repeat-containing protein [Acidimicrobiales bacterium]
MRPRFRRLAACTVALASAALTLPAGGAGGRPAAAVSAALPVKSPTLLAPPRPEGFLPATAANVSVVGKLELTQRAGRVADVGVWNGYAYLGAFRQPDCGSAAATEPDGGVYVVDLADPANPKPVGFIPAHDDTYVGEGVQALTITTPAFNGDLLVFNNEGCGPAARGGLSLWDVSDPRTPKALAENAGDLDVNGVARPWASFIHSAFAWDAGERAYAVTVDDFEFQDVDILDITDPSKPVLIAEYDLTASLPQIVQPELGPGESYFHDVVVKQIGAQFVMLLSYWDGGYVLLDVTDPERPSFLGDSDFPSPDEQLAEQARSSMPPEGNAHQAEFSADNRYIVAADEDFTPAAVAGRNVTEGRDFTVAGDVASLHAAGDTAPPGTSVFLGAACPGGPALPAGDGASYAVVEGGQCSTFDKLFQVGLAGGYLGVVVMAGQGPGGCSRRGAPIPNSRTFFVSRPDGLALFGRSYDEAACLAGGAPAPLAIGARGAQVEFAVRFDGWGYVRLFRAAPGADKKLVQTDTWAIPEAMDATKAKGSGALSVHEAATSARRGDLVYFAYYAGGFRVARIVEDKLVETGRFIDEGGANLWGVQVFEHAGRELVAASDRDYGLYVFEYTGPGGPNAGAGAG